MTEEKMEKIIFATENAHKMEEIREILRDLPCELLSMKEAGIKCDIVEDGQSFAENAMKKAKAVCEASGCITMADDSGLCVDYLDGAPGIYSSRWMGEDTSYHVKNNELIRLLEGVPDEKRSARFICAIVCAFPEGSTYTAQASYEGRIGYEEKGENGFGYDPVFYVPEKGRYSAELSPEEKNEISHRGKALRKMKVILKRELQ